VFKWTKESAIVELRRLITEVGGLSNGERFSAAHTRWLATTTRFLEEVFGASSTYLLTFSN